MTKLREVLYSCFGHPAMLHATNIIYGVNLKDTGFNEGADMRNLLGGGGTLASVILEDICGLG